MKGFLLYCGVFFFTEPKIKNKYDTAVVNGELNFQAEKKMYETAGAGETNGSLVCSSATCVYCSEEILNFAFTYV